MKRLNILMQTDQSKFFVTQTLVASIAELPVLISEISGRCSPLLLGMGTSRLSLLAVAGDNLRTACRAPYLSMTEMCDGILSAFT